MKRGNRKGNTYNTSTKLYLVTREETIIVRFEVRAHSHLEARMTPTPAGAQRWKSGETRGETVRISQPGYEITRGGKSLVDGELAIADE